MASEFREKSSLSTMHALAGDAPLSKDNKRLSAVSARALNGAQVIAGQCLGGDRS